MNATGRWAVWIVLFGAAAGLVLFDRNETRVGAIVDAAPRRATGSPTSNVTSGSARDRTEGAMILAIQPRAESSKVDDAFPVRDWRPPPPPTAKPGPPPSPVAPELPYTVLGKKLEDGAWQVFLRRDDRILVVKSLDTIENAYRVDEIRPPVMTLTYLPLGQRQTIPIGGGE